MKKCAVIGSVNMDMVVSTPRFPRPGETLTGRAFQTAFGGKGANQAVAMARLGAEVKMAGRVGNDAFGREYLAHFSKVGVNAACVTAVEDCATGVADIQVSDDGENTLVYIPGANARCDLAWLEGALAETADCDIFLLQLELPLETVCEAVRRLHAAGKTILLDPAPAVPLPEDVLHMVDILTPNETELCILTSSLPEDASVEARVQHLIGSSDRMVIHKRGSDGAYIATRDSITHVPGFRVNAVDPTAAGDTFNAGLACAMARGEALADAVRYANAAAAISVTGLGAQTAMPTDAEARALMLNPSR